jgi:hypothetical protein
MKTHILRVWLYIILCVSFWTCKSNNPTPLEQLPPETQTGANTAGALIDGQPWIPNGGGGFSQIPPISRGYISPSVNRPKNCVWLSFARDDKTSITLYVKSVEKAGRYLLNFTPSVDIALANTQNFGLYTIDGKTIDDPDYNYITTSQYTGFVDFTVADTLTKQLSGTFEFEAIDQPSGKKIKITQGRFDVNQLKR